jgi:hypothetical protein
MMLPHKAFFIALPLKALILLLLSAREVFSQASLFSLIPLLFFIIIFISIVVRSVKVGVAALVLDLEELLEVLEGAEGVDHGENVVEEEVTEEDVEDRGCGRVCRIECLRGIQTGASGRIILLGY